MSEQVVINDQYSYEQALVAIAELTTDIPFQREVDSAQVQQIKREFDRDWFDPIEVSRRDGTLFVIDGRRRISAAVGMGWTHVRANIRSDLTYRSEAKVFSRQAARSRRPLPPIVLFWSQYEAGDNTTHEIDNIVREFGLSITNRRESGIRAIGSILNLHRRGLLRQTLSVMTSAWGVDYAYFKAKLIDGVGEFLWRYRFQQIDLPRLIAKLAERDSTGMNRLADKKAKSGNNAHGQGHGQAILELYNQQLTTNQLPAWTEIIDFK